MTCVNYSCDEKTWGCKIRCSNCRRKGEFRCHDCGVSHNQPRAVLCKECQRGHYEIAHTYNYYKKDEFCIICNDKLELNHTKLCSDMDCKRVYLKLHQEVYQNGKKMLTV